MLPGKYSTGSRHMSSIRSHVWPGRGRARAGWRQLGALARKAQPRCLAASKPSRHLLGRGDSRGPQQRP